MTRYAAGRKLTRKAASYNRHSQDSFWNSDVLDEDTGVRMSLLMPSLSVAAYFLPAAYAVSSRLYFLWQIAVTTISVVYILLYVTRCRITLRWLVASLFFTHYYLVSSILSRADGSIASDLFYTGASIGFLSMAEYGLSRERRRWVLAFVVGGSMLCAIHYITYLRYADVVGGMRAGYVEIRYGRATTQHWFFFTHDNGSLFYFLPVLACAWHYTIELHSKGMLAYSCLLSLITELMYIKLWSVSAMVAIAMFLVAIAVIAFGKLKRLPWGMTLQRVVILGLVVPMILVFFGGNQTLTNIFQTFSKTIGSRSIIWSRSLLAIAEHPLVGNGVELGMTTTLRIGINHCHNIALQVLYASGIIGFSLVLLYVFAGLPQKRTHLASADLVVLFAVFVLELASSFDWYVYMIPQYFLLALCAYPTEVSRPREIERHEEAHTALTTTIMYSGSVDE